MLKKHFNGIESGMRQATSNLRIFPFASLRWRTASDAIVGNVHLCIGALPTETFLRFSTFSQWRRIFCRADGLSMNNGYHSAGMTNYYCARDQENTMNWMRRNAPTPNANISRVLGAAKIHNRMLDYSDNIQYCVLSKMRNEHFVPHIVTKSARNSSSSRESYIIRNIHSALSALILNPVAGCRYAFSCSWSFRRALIVAHESACEWVFVCVRSSYSLVDTKWGARDNILFHLPFHSFVNLCFANTHTPSPNVLSFGSCLSVHTYIFLAEQTTLMRKLKSLNLCQFSFPIAPMHALAHSVKRRM